MHMLLTTVKMMLIHHCYLFVVKAMPTFDMVYPVTVRNKCMLLVVGYVQNVLITLTPSYNLWVSAERVCGVLGEFFSLKESDMRHYCDIASHIRFIPFLLCTQAV